VVEFAIGLRVQNCTHIADRKQDGKRPVWFYGLTDRSWAVVVFRDDRETATVHQAGPRRLWDEVEAAYRWWDHHDRPGFQRFGLKVSADGEDAWLDTPGNLVAVRMNEYAGRWRPGRHHPLRWRLGSSLRVREAGRGSVTKRVERRTHARSLDEVLVPCGITLLEQPVPAADLGVLAEVHERSPIPVIADESVTDLASLRPLIGKCSGIDIKLTMCGGMREALRLIYATEPWTCRS
jgi:L-alanine-DL-glutamate epimerase-like enolase superfamily enzyme